MNELLLGYVYLIFYIVLVLPCIILIRAKTNIPDEVYRKSLHFVLLGIIPLWLYVYDHWWTAVHACFVLMILFYPILALAEKIPWCADFLIQRKNGEFRSSLVQVFLMFAIVICICRGLYDDRLLALASIYAWGPGDAAAALIGKRFGKHKIHVKGVDGKKSFEGTMAMFAVSLFSLLIILLIRGRLSLPECMVISILTAFVSSMIELFTKNGNDTITCPLGAMVTLIALLSFFGGVSL